MTDNILVFYLIFISFLLLVVVVLVICTFQY
jgi:hypothetical protein